MQRQYMIRNRERRGLTILEMAVKCSTAAHILTRLESCDQEITHPKIAARVGKAYRLTKKQTEGLMPEHYRPSSPNYDPNLHRRDNDELKQVYLPPRRG